MPYGMTDAEYAAEVNRKKKAGVALTGSFDQSAYDRGTKTSSTNKSSSSYWDSSYGGKDKYITDQQDRYKDADDDLRRRLEADAERVGYNLPTSGKTSTQSKLSKQSTPQSQNIDEILSRLSDTMGQYSAPYEQMYRDLIANYPKGTVPTEEEMLDQSNQWANLQIDPQMQALQRALEQARLSTQNQQGSIEANYASFDDSVNRMLEQAGDRATESAIARGGGRSGAVEWLNDKYSTPIMEQATTQQAKKTADLNALAESLGLTEQQGSQQMQQLESRRGELESNRLAELRNLSQATQAGDWQRIAQATQNLMALSTQANQFNQSFASNLLPYFTPTVGQEMDYNVNLLNNTGEVTQDMSSMPSATPVSLRSYAAEQGGSIGYDPATKSVTINGKKYSTDALQKMGGQVVNGNWHIPQSALNGLF